MPPPCSAPPCATARRTPTCSTARPGSGKREAAREFAAELLSRDAPDPENARARALSGSHPDLTWVAPSGAHIMLRGDVDQSVVAAASHTPFEAAWRVFVLERADTMDDPAANTLLKTLEEPPELRRADPAHRPPDAGAADDHLALPGRALRRAAAGAARRAAGVARRRPRRAPAPARGSRSATASGRSALALGDGPALRARAEAFARAALDGDVGKVKPWTELLAAARTAGDAAQAELEAALATELEYLPKKEHRRKQTEFTERARRAARRAETGALDHALQLVGLWYRDLACMAADAEELVLATDRLERAARRRPRRPRAARRARARRGHARAAAVQRQLRPRAAGARLPARAHARGRDRPGMTEVRIRGAYATVRGPGIEDEVAVEEPLEIRVDGAALAVTMRTPGDDEELALGFLHGEGLIDAARPAGPTAELEANTVEVTGPLLREPGTRSFYATSSCGVCGKGALEEVAVHARARARRPGRSRATCSPRCPTACASRPSSAPAGCTPPGCSTPDGELLLVREDVGRHNAMDKVIGRALRDGLVPLHDHVLCVSGRLSFELVQKAAVAGVPDAGRRRRPELARGPARRRPQHDAGRLRAPRARERLHRRRAGRRSGPIGPSRAARPCSSKLRKRLKCSCSGPWKSAEPVESSPSALARVVQQQRLLARVLGVEALDAVEPLARRSSAPSAAPGRASAMSQNGWAQTATPPAAWMTSIASSTVGRERAT